MSTSWRQLLFQILLTLVCCRRIDTKTPDPTPTPLTSAPTPVALSRKVVLTGQNHTEYIKLLNPVNLSLECTWAGEQRKPPNVTAFWTKEGQEVQDSRVTLDLDKNQYHLSRLFSIVSQESLGKYTCVFGDEARVDFLLATPHFSEQRDKPVVSYVGDFVSLTCKIEKDTPQPLVWNWFKGNETHKEQIFEDPVRYEIHSGEQDTKLKVMNLTAADTGHYYCGAKYAIGTTTNAVKLKVITYMEPLKPLIGILVEVVVLVAIIAICEKRQAKKRDSNEAEGTADQNNIQLQGQDKVAEEGSTTRQRKV